MPGPCPNGRPTEAAHREAKCRDAERCVGPGCRMRRRKRELRPPELTDD